MTSDDLRIDPRIDLRIDLNMDLPHALILRVPEIPVSVIIPCKTAENQSVENTRRTRETWLCSRPLGSPTACLKRSYITAPWTPRVVVQRPCSGVRDWVLPGWGIGGWVGGWVIPVHYPAARGGSQNQRSGPRRPQQGRSGWVLGAGRPVHIPAGPGRSSGPPLHLLEQVPPKGPKNGETSENQ